MLLRLERDHVFAIRGDRDGNVWAATNKGLLRFRDDALAGSLSVKDGLPNEFMTLDLRGSPGPLVVRRLRRTLALRARHDHQLHDQ